MNVTWSKTMTTSLPVINWCDPDDNRMKLPWKLPDGRIAATNGRAVIVVDADRYDGPLQTDAKSCKWLTTITDRTLQGFQMELERVRLWHRLPKQQSCDTCGGSGLYQTTCRTCGGQKTTTACEVPCENCNGEGTIEAACARCGLQLAGRYFQQQYINLYRSLTKCRWGTVSNRLVDKSADPIYLCFTGGWGVVMPFFAGRATRNNKTMKVLQIRDWEEHFEKRPDYKGLKWVAVPNKLDGSGYTELVDHPDGAAHYGAWIALLLIASKCRPRGTLLWNRQGLLPHDPTSLSRISRIPSAVFQEAIPRLLTIGWLEQITYPGSRTDPSGSRTDPCLTEHNITEHTIINQSTKNVSSRGGSADDGLIDWNLEEIDWEQIKRHVNRHLAAAVDRHHALPPLLTDGRHRPNPRGIRLLARACVAIHHAGLMGQDWLDEALDALATENYKHTPPAYLKRCLSAAATARGFDFQAFERALDVPRSVLEGVVTP